MLTLPIKQKWFDAIAAGIKTEEYREIKPYYTARLQNILAPYYRQDKQQPAGQGEQNTNRSLGDQQWLEECEYGRYDSEPFDVCFRNGYNRSSPTFVAACTLRTGTGNPEWGAVPGTTYYILTIRDIRSTSEEQNKD